MRSYQKNINKINSLFVIYTPYQLFSALNIIDTLENDSSIDIVFMHPNMMKYAKLIEENYKIKIFNYQIGKNEENNYKIKILIHINLIRAMIASKKEIKNEENSKVEYGKIYIPSDSIGCNVIFSHFYKLNNKIELNIFDDGIGTYKKNYLDASKKKMYGRISRFILGNFFWENIAKLYCYKPKLVDGSYKIEIKELQMCNKVKKIISLNGEKQYFQYKNKNLIYLDQGEVNEVLDQFFIESKKRFKKESIISKVHPRLEPYIPQDYAVIDNSGVAFESIYSNLEEQEEIVIISSFSTACITPYVLFNKFPYIIFLGRIDSDGVDHIFESMYIKKIYEEYKPERLFIPKTNNELKLNLEYISMKLNKKESGNKSNEN